MTAVSMIYPKFYMYNRYGSDRKFIMQRMAVIPDEKKQEVADKYEKIFMQRKKNFRFLANEYLHKEARKYQPKTEH